MSPVLALLLNSCQAVLAGDAQCIAWLRAEGFECETGRWQFCLPALHGVLMKRLPVGERVDYPRFVRELYASDLNTRLRVLGAQVVILDNRGKVDTSLYGLCRLEEVPESLP